MDCQEVHKFVHAYLDGEFAEDDRVAFAAHLAACEPCSRIARFEERFKEKLRSSETERGAPPRLRARVEGVLAQEAQQQQRLERRKRWTWRLVPALAAAAVIGALGITLGLRERSQAADPMTLAEQSVRWHRRKLPLDVTDSHGDAIQRFFRDKVPFAVRLPRFANPNAKLVGARLTQLHGNEAVYLTYQVGKQRVSVFVVDPRALSGTQDRRIHWRGVRGYNVGTFVSDGTGYAVTSEMDRGRLVRLISHSE